MTNNKKEIGLAITKTFDDGRIIMEFAPKDGSAPAIEGASTAQLTNDPTATARAVAVLLNMEAQLRYQISELSASAETLGAVREEHASEILKLSAELADVHKRVSEIKEAEEAANKAALERKENSELLKQIEALKGEKEMLVTSLTDYLSHDHENDVEGSNQKYETLAATVALATASAASTPSEQETLPTLPEREDSDTNETTKD